MSRKYILFADMELDFSKKTFNLYVFHKKQLL